MKHFFSVTVFWYFFSIRIFSQESIECQFFAGKEKIYFSINNISNDTVRIALKSLYYEFWNKPVLNNDYRISGDTFWIILAHYPSQPIQSNGEPIRYKIDGERAQNVILPNNSFQFYLKIKKAKPIGKKIKNIQIVSNNKLPFIKTIRLQHNDIDIKFNPIKAGQMRYRKQ